MRLQLISMSIIRIWKDADSVDFDDHARQAVNQHDRSLLSPRKLEQCLIIMILVMLKYNDDT
jgi:hypothetical protein